LKESKVDNRGGGVNKNKTKNSLEFFHFKERKKRRKKEIK